MTPKMLKLNEAAERLNCSRIKLDEIRGRYSLPHIPGRPILILEDDLPKYADALKRPTPVRDGRLWAREAVLLRRTK